MKKILLTLFLIVGFTVVKSQIPGTKIPGPITVLDTLKVNEGDILTLGHGSDPRTGDFVFIYTPANYWVGTPMHYYPNTFSNTTLKVKFFKEYEQRKIGKKIYTVVDVPGYNAIAELEAAIKSGEVVAINGKDVSIKPKEATVIINNQVSAADELKKLKELLNDSVITQEEFDIQKKKILESK